jgi:acyl phosphate:glycerol-3-phosphate acyltransferase
MGLTLVLRALSYLLGSVPTGYLLVRGLRGVDVREYGSQTFGAINVMRVAGLRVAVLTLLLDAGKAWLVVGVAVHVLPGHWAIAACAVAVIVGHAYSVWFLLHEGRFAQGKSVASSLGLAIGVVQTGLLPWPVLVIPLGLWVGVLLGARLITRRWQPLSLSTMTAVAALPVVTFLVSTDVAWRATSVLVSALVLLRHRGNIRRLIAGTESSAADAYRASRRS